MNYRETIDALVDRISALIPQHPEILRMKSPWELFDLEDFKCDDLEPTMPQATAALSFAVKTREFLLWEIATLEGLLDDLPEENVIERAGLEERLRQARERLTNLGENHHADNL